MKFQLTTADAYKIFSSVALAISPDKTRPHMHAMLLRVTPAPEGARLIACATNGHWLAKWEQVAPAYAEPGDFLLAAEHVDALVKTLRKARKTPGDLLFVDGEITLAGIRTVCPRVDMTFPPYVQVIPARPVKHVPFGVSCEYLQAAGKAFALAGYEGCLCYPGANALDPILFVGEENYADGLTVVVMPRRADALRVKAPAKKGRRAA